MPVCIEVRGGKKISEGVIVSLHHKRLVDEILFEMVHNSPLKCEELGLAQVIVPLSLSQQLTSVRNQM